MNLEDLSNTISPENEFGTILQICVLIWTESRALSKLMIEKESAGNDEVRLRLTEEYQKFAQSEMTKVIEYLYKKFGYLPPEILGE